MTASPLFIFDKNGSARERYMERVTLEKSKAFAVRIVNLHKYLCNEHKAYDIAKQILRCGTSIGANLSESECAISRNDFKSKIYIALKEACETKFWIELLHDTDYIDDAAFNSIYEDCLELIRLLMATTKTLSKTKSK